MARGGLSLRRSGSRRSRPSRFPMPGFPRGASRRGSRAARFLLPRSTRQVKTRAFSTELLGAVAMLTGIFLWGGLLALLAA